MKNSCYCCMAFFMFSVTSVAQAEDANVAAVENEFIEFDLETLLTLKFDPNTTSLLESHIHRAGEWMMSYKFMSMDMAGNRSGSRSLSTDDVLGTFMVAPTSMSMQMHMLSAMYAPTDRVTLMVMLPYRSLSIDHITRMGQAFTTESSGIGDVGVMGNFLLAESEQHRWTVNGGVMLPVGSIDERGDTPAGAQVKLPYPMQLGSGTYDLLAGIAYQNINPRWSWGTNVKSVLRLGKNDNHYRLGNKLDSSVWYSHAWTPVFGTMLKLQGFDWGDISGADPDLNPAMVPTADPGLRGGRRVKLHIVPEYYQMEGRLKGLRISLDFGIPVYQSLHGPQLEFDWSLAGVIQWTF